MKTDINVLIVDDSEIIVRYLTIMLKGIKNIQFLEAATLLNARGIIVKEPIDIIVLDIEMPDGNGIDFIKWIKKTNSGITIVMFSTLADSQFRKAAKKKELNIFLISHMSLKK